VSRKQGKPQASPSNLRCNSKNRSKRFRSSPRRPFQRPLPATRFAIKEQRLNPDPQP
jgi:hypothetical protein